MQLFVDTANIDEIKKAAEWGVTGVTTNPSLVSKENRKFTDIIREICQTPGIDSVSAEVISTDLQGMLKEARKLVQIDKQKIVVKIPMISDGIMAVKQLKKEGIRCNVTLVFSLDQAILAANAGAYYVSPFIGRLDDIGHDGMELIREMREAFDLAGYEPRVLAASIRHTDHVRQAALSGADILTIPFNVLEKMFSHPLTDKGLKNFLADWDKVPKELKQI